MAVAGIQLQTRVGSVRVEFAVEEWTWCVVGRSALRWYERLGLWDICVEVLLSPRLLEGTAVWDTGEGLCSDLAGIARKAAQVAEFPCMGWSRDWAGAGIWRGDAG